jgi:uncharacterized ParB-like nuclease family protein
MPIRSLQIVTITRDSTMQPREQINKSAVKEYAEEFKAGAEPDPIGVVSDGKTNWVWDGFHRIAAYEELGRSAIDCNVTEGNRLDAIRLSLGANAAHGQRRTNEDKRRAVMRALSVPEWKEKKLQEIADWCAVSLQTAKNYRDQLSNFESSNGEVPRVRGADGKSYPMKYTKKKEKPKPSPVSHLESQDDPPPQDAAAAPQDGEGIAEPGKNESNPAPHVDQVGHELPGSLFVTFDSLSTYKEILSLYKSLFAKVQALAQAPGGELLRSGVQTIQARTNDILATVKCAQPFARCHRCKGKGCDFCKGLGWYTKIVYDNSAEAKA